ncbi:NAD(P)/FAD-dependent oxidoreductase [Paenibacillus methanolicus]|uniref:Glycine/D-amino acid oxidase-like deaminating enzyme n=1 Tax=Paenibacillus methanolicus TaxID=582686 RepID=A0A5S5BTH0_9BACL|nr:FAD-dependent oxidoreductase [Paenibacillus methanolicus]TYP70307.1 glycine/D-amino acid oxidase-like deaminating enzyme [Paenibacillus methanolicus]
MTTKPLYSGKLYWPDTLPAYTRYPQLAENRSVRVAVVGGGMSGVLCAHALASAGIDTLLVERDEIAVGSSAANTGLLQFSNDIMLVELMAQVGDGRAVDFYRACRRAVDQLEQRATELRTDAGFRRTSSLYYASEEQDVPKLRREYEALFHNGFDVEYWEADRIAAHFPFRKAGAIVTHGDAEINPFRFVHGLADQAVRHGLAVCEHTGIISHIPANGFHRLMTETGAVIEAEHVIYAVGYEPEELRGHLIKAELNRSFAMVTEPVPSLAGWHKQWMIWETRRPYLYLRTTQDGRVVIGGLDEDEETPVTGGRELRAHTDRLERELGALFPDIDARAAYEWSATFGESRDGLPFIGPDPALPGIYYCLGYGGNGTVYSMLASQLLLDLIRGEEPDPIASLLRLDRPAPDRRLHA